MTYNPGVRMRNKAQWPGCIGRSAASQACQARSVAYIKAAACHWVRPAAARRSLMALGVGEVAAGGAPRFGWLDISVGLGVVEADMCLTLGLGVVIFCRNLAHFSVFKNVLPYHLSSCSVFEGRREWVAKPCKRLFDVF